MSSKVDNTTSSLIGNDVVVMPRNVFSSRLSHFIYTHKVFSLVLASGIVILSLLSWVARRTDGLIYLIWFIGTIFMVPPVIGAYVGTSELGLTSANELIFLKEVTVTKPGLDNKEWDLIASRLNAMFYENSSSATPYFFYDGEACASLFKSRFLEPYLKRQQEANSRTEATASETEQAKWGSSELEPFIAEAVNAYQESLKSRWNILTRGEASDGSIV